jgi:hypothetical protein
VSSVLYIPHYGTQPLGILVRSLEEQLREERTSSAELRRIAAATTQRTLELYVPATVFRKRLHKEEHSISDKDIH